MNLKEAHVLFLNESDFTIGFSKFCQLRPQHVLPLTLRDHEQCMCRYHENIELLACGIKKLLPNFPSTAEDVVEYTLCDSFNENCIDCRCDICDVHLIEDFTDGCDTQSPCTYYQWQPGELGTEKVPHQSSLDDAIEMLAKQLQPFSRHVFDMRRQHFEIRHLKNTLPRGSIILQTDFAENYALKHQREIMSAHWANSSVTIYTGMVYVRDAPEEPLWHQSFAIVSDDPNHDKRAVYAFNQQILADVQETLPWNIEHVHYWSDGPANQFKNCFTINNLLHHEEDYGSTADWSFFATAHGKGPIDGIGGEVKRQVWLAVL